MKKITLIAIIISAAFLLLPNKAFASYTLFDDASLVSPGNSSLTAAQIISSSTGIGWGGVNFTITTGVKFSDFTQLKTDYNITTGNCGGGAPRFQLNIDGKNVFVYIGPVPNFTGCTTGIWQVTENFIGSTDTVFDLSQYGGPWYGTYAQAISLLGDHEVTGVQLLVDGYWAIPGGVQTVLTDNVLINNDIYTFEPPPNKNDCKKDGWKTFTDPTFKNQGDCVSYFQSNENAVGNRKNN